MVMDKKFLRLLPLLILAGIVLLQGIFVYRYLIRPQGPFGWDEAHRSLISLATARHLEAGDLAGFWRLTNRQIYWPFLHYWVSSVFLLIGGYTYSTARFMSLVMNAGAVFLICLTGRKAASSGREASGLIAAGLLISSPLFCYLAGTAMAESLGTFLTLAVLLSYLTARENDRPGWFLAAGVLLALLYFTKYIYAVFFGFSLFLFWLSILLIERDRERCRVELRRIWLFAAGFLALWLLWLASGHAGEKINIILYRMGETSGWDFLGLKTLDRVLYYPRALLTAYALSPWVFPAYLGGLAWGGFRLRDLRVRLLFILFWGSLLPIARSPNLQERFIATTAVPALFLLTALFLVDLARRIPPRAGRWLLAAWLVLIAGDLPKFPGYVRIIGNNALGSLNLPAPKIVPRDALFGLARYPEFFYQPKNLLSPEHGDRTGSESLENVFDFIWKNSDPGYPLAALFQLNCASGHLWQWHGLVRQRAITGAVDPRCAYFAVLRVRPGSPYLTLSNQSMLADRVDGPRRIVEELAERGLVEAWTSRDFPGLGLTATIYRRRAAPRDPGWQGFLPRGGER